MTKKMKKEDTSPPPAHNESESESKSALLPPATPDELVEKIELKRDRDILLKKPKFNPREKFIDNLIHDPESLSVIQSCVDVLVAMRAKLPNQFTSHVQIYSSLLKVLYIYENMIKNVYGLKQEEFKHLQKVITDIDRKTINNIDFKAISKRISDRKEQMKMRHVAKTESGLSYIVGDVEDSEEQPAEKKEKERKRDYIA